MRRVTPRSSGKPYRTCVDGRRLRRVAMVDSEGDAAVARLEHELPNGRWIDYASLLKVGGQWRIVGLIYAKQDAGR